MPKVGTAYVSIRARLDRLEKDLGTAKSTTLKRANETSRAVSNVFKGVVAYFGVTQIKAFGESLFEAGKYMNQLNKAYTEISGSAAAANAEFDFLRQTSDDLGQNFYDLADAYKGIAAASKGTNLEGQATRDIFVAITKASASLGLSADDTRGALVAIQQMMSKGKVSAEELRQQLGERLPGAFNLMAEAMGVSTAELDKMLKDGKVLAGEALPRLATVLEGRYTGAVDDATRASNKFSEAWQDFKVAIGDGEFITDATDAINSLSSALSSPGVQEGFKTLIGLLGQTVKAIADLIQSTAGWAAVGRGDLGFFEFATMNAEDLAEWLEKNRSGVGKLDAELKKLNEQLRSESSFFAFSSSAQAEKQTRIDVILAKIKELKHQKEALMLSGYDSPVVYNTQTEIPEIQYTNLSKDTMDAHVHAWKNSQEAIEEYNKILSEAEVEQDKFNAIVLEMNGGAVSGRWKSMQDAINDDYISALKEAEYETQHFNEIVSEMNGWQDGNQWEAMQAQLKKLQDDSKETADVMKDAFTGWATSISSDLADMALDGKIAFDDLARSATKFFLQFQIQKGISTLANFDWSSLFTTASTLHSGGIVGTDGVQTVVPASVFAGAPRLHTGLEPDEFPAILQRGETVLPKGNSQTVKNNIQVVINEGQSSNSVTQNQQGDVTQLIINLVASDISGRGKTFKAISNLTGIQPSTRRA